MPSSASGKVSRTDDATTMQRARGRRQLLLPRLIDVRAACWVQSWGV